MNEVNSIPVVSLRIKEDSKLYAEEPISNAEDAVKIFTKAIYKDLGFQDRESFLLLNLNTKNQPINMSVVAVGSLDHALIDIKSVFKTALLSNTAKMIVFHNHPSGCNTPSLEDIRFTDLLYTASNLMGLQLLDHIIVAKDCMSNELKLFSFNEHHLFPDGIYRDRLFETDIDLSKIRDEAMAEEVLDIER